jgi:HEPN domain-containing protein
MVTQWFAKASQNIRLTKLILDLDEKFYEHICFNAQQSAEMAIKGFLAFNRTRFDKTHDIEVLVGLVRDVDSELANLIDPANVLTKYAIRIRA